MMATADEADAGNQAFDDPRLRLRRVPGNAFCRLNEPATCNRHEREGAQAGTSFVALAIPSDGQGKHIGKGQGGDVRQYPQRLEQVLNLFHSTTFHGTKPDPGERPRT
jgi:hypothetical protein